MLCHINFNHFLRPGQETECSSDQDGNSDFPLLYNVRAFTLRLSRRDFHGIRPSLPWPKGLTQGGPHSWGCPQGLNRLVVQKSG